MVILLKRIILRLLENGLLEQRGINKIMHGWIKDTILESELLVVKCKNGEQRCIKPEQILGFFKNKKECYEFTGEIKYHGDN